MKVENLEQARDFYSQLFNQEPTIERDGYIKWDVADPAVNFVIENGEGATGVDHLGIQVESSDELGELAARMQDSGQPYLDVDDATCCYAKSVKAWVKGVTGEKWEVFLTHSHDEAEYGEDRAHLLDAM
jgi:hypothetical protein